jgi:outer membrane protein assembly factor BamA
MFQPTRYYLIAYLLIAFSINNAIGQTEIKPKKDSIAIKQKDIVDLFRKRSIQKTIQDSTHKKGYGPFFSCMPAVGYTMLSGLTGTFVASTSFYTDTNRIKFSSILLNSNYSQYNQYWFILNNNIFIEKHKLHYVGDTRYYKFPTNTYGLDIKNKLNDALPIDYSYLRAYEYLYREMAKNLYLGIGYNLDYHWNISSDSTPTKTYNDFKQYNTDKHSISSGLSFNVQFDNRKNASNPQNGYYALMQYRTNMTVMGSDSNWQYLLLDIRHYLKFPASSKNILCFWSYNKITFSGTAPYLDLPSIGWDEYSNTGRGYVPGRYTGKNLFYIESEYRFTLTRNGLLGGVVFGNAESVLQSISDNVKTVIPGGGFGLRIKMNKRSNTNIAIDYGFGVGGSHGLIFNLGEVF